MLTEDESNFLHEIYLSSELDEFLLWIEHMEEDFSNGKFKEYCI